MTPRASVPGTIQGDDRQCLFADGIGPEAARDVSVPHDEGKRSGGAIRARTGAHD